MEPSSVYISHDIKSIKFSSWSSDAIRKISVKHVTRPELVDVLNIPIPGGLYDAAMGPLDKKDKCATCSLSYSLCPGHFGHVDLPVPLYNPLFFSYLRKIVRNSCPCCHYFRFPRHIIYSWTIQLELLQKGLYFETKELQDHMIEWGNDLLDFGSSKEVIDYREQSLAEQNTNVTIIRKIDAYYKECSFLPVSKNRNVSSLIDRERKSIMLEFLGSPNRAVCANCQRKSHQVAHFPDTVIFHIPEGSDIIDDIESSDAEVSDDQAEKSSEVNESGGDMSDASSDVPGRKRKALKPIDAKQKRYKGKNILNPLRLSQYISKLWKNERQFLDQLFDGADLISLFFINTVPIPPNKFRPPAMLNGNLMNHPQNLFLQEIITMSSQFISFQQNTAQMDENDALMDLWHKIQVSLEHMYDSSTIRVRPGKTPPQGIKQILEKKEGIFRQHMMGKRVNHSARSVISPDVHIGTHEIGIPMVFATKLVVPESVTLFNVHRLRRSIIQGPYQHPGATHVQYEDGSLQSLEFMTAEAREAIANQLLTPNDQKSVIISGNGNKIPMSWAPKKVHRHLQDGDMLLVNRQPTLHKPSIMAHTCKVLPGERTIRMHYTNCDTYNADFDGDEMNIHFPQDDLGRAEAAWIAHTDLQYLVPTDGSPLRGLIQDHIDAAVILTLRGRWLTRCVYQQLLSGCLSDDFLASRAVQVEPPTVVKPIQLWSGKQVISTLLTNVLIGLSSSCVRPLTMWNAKCKLSSKLIGDEESKVSFLNGYFIQGVIDKAHIGSSAYGLVHYCYELYGPKAAGVFLTVLGKLLTRVLQMTGFSCGMDDILLQTAIDRERVRLVQNVPSGDGAIRELAQDTSEDVAEQVFRNPEARRALDARMRSMLGKHTSTMIEMAIPGGTIKPFPLNNMTMMTMSGAKGSLVNFSQISGALGQQELEGQRVPIMPSGKTLPCFPAFDVSARAGGYVSDRFWSGVRPQEYFFHCMAGREGLIDTAVKTSRSGYLQRCLIKHLEDVHVQQDLTVRNAEGSILQFYYGEDGLDVTKQSFLQDASKLDALSNNIECLVDRYKPREVLDLLNTQDATKYHDKYKEIRIPAKERDWLPAMELYSPSIYLGSVSEKFSERLEDYLEHLKKMREKYSESPMLLASSCAQHSSKEDRMRLRALLWLKYMRSLVEPGEAVGILASQSIGEPSTQMTLNTFHLAGFGAQNVTLGVPRLREIIMVASKAIKTPMMTIPFYAGRVNPSDAEKIAQEFNPLTMADLVTKMQFTESIQFVDVWKRIDNITLEIDPEVLKFPSVFEYIQRGFSRDFSMLFDISLAGGDMKTAIRSGSEHEEKKEIKPRHKTKAASRSNCEIDVSLGDLQNLGLISVRVAMPPSGSNDSILPELVEQVLSHCVINKKDGVNRASVTEIKGKSGETSLALVTNGLNLVSLVEDYRQVFDVNNMTSNDIYYMLTTFGVEAARQTIIQEIGTVFGAYGISVDTRHLQLIADYMTLEGGYKPMNRTGMEMQGSPFARMTFESCMTYLKDAVFNQDMDVLEHPSASLVVGQPVRHGGSGLVDIVPIY